MLGTATAYYASDVEEVERKIEMADKGQAPRKAVVRQLECLAVSEISEKHYRIDAPTLVILQSQQFAGKSTQAGLGRLHLADVLTGDDEPHVGARTEPAGAHLKP